MWVMGRLCVWRTIVSYQRPIIRSSMCWALCVFSPPPNKCVHTQACYYTDLHRGHRKWSLAVHTDSCSPALHYIWHRGAIPALHLLTGCNFCNTPAKGKHFLHSTWQQSALPTFIPENRVHVVHHTWQQGAILALHLTTGWNFCNTPANGKHFPH